MELVKFTNMLGGSDPASPPFRIPARDLDRNFAMLKPLRTDGNARQYLLTETPEGWSIKIFPDFPSGEGPFFLAFANGRLYWTGSNVDEPETGNDGLVPNAPASGTYVLGSVGGVVQWLPTQAC